MTSAPSRGTLEVRHLQLARAVFAAIAAAMITFTADHSAQVGLAVFSGFAIATGLVLLLAVWLVYPAGSRATAVLLGIVAVIAGMIAGIVGIRSTTLFFVVVIVWALVSGIIETISGWRGLRAAKDAPVLATARGNARDSLVIGIVTLVFGLGLLLVPTSYVLDYSVDEHSFTLTGIAIGVGVFGGYAAIVAVYLAIAGLSPRAAVAAPEPPSAPSAGDVPGGVA